MLPTLGHPYFHAHQGFKKCSEDRARQDMGDQPQIRHGLRDSLYEKHAKSLNSCNNILTMWEWVYLSHDSTWGCIRGFCLFEACFVLYSVSLFCVLCDCVVILWSVVLLYLVYSPRSLSKSEVKGCGNPTSTLLRYIVREKCFIDRIACW